MKRFYDILFSTAILALFAFMATQNAAAGGEGKFDFNIRYEEPSSVLSIAVGVTGEDQPVKFELYQMNGVSKKYDELAFYKELTPDTSYITYDGGMKITYYQDELEYKDSIPASFYLKATFSDGTVKLSSIQYINGWKPPVGKISFKSEPENNAKINEEYVYEVKAKSPDGKQVYYFLEYGPTGAQIDKTTGKLTWTPAKYGRNHFDIYASTKADADQFDDDESRTHQRWEVRVNKCEKASSIICVIKDQNGKPPKYAFIGLLILDTETNGYTSFSYSDGKDGVYEFTNLDEGTYIARLYSKERPEAAEEQKIILGCDERKTLEFIIKSPDMNDRITIGSVPPTFVKLGDTYSYDVNAKAPNASLEIKYRFEESPKGAQIDVNTGLITWTPENLGIYYFVVHAYSEKNGQSNLLNTVQGWNVTVTQCAEVSTLKIAVKFDDGTPLRNAVAYLFNRAKYDSSYSGTVMFKTEVKEGTATFENLDKGTYFLMVDDFDRSRHNGYESQRWYEDAYKIDDATPIVIDCGEEKSLEMIFKTPPPPTYYKVSGKVTDEEGNPIPNAVVTIYDDKSKLKIFHPTTFQTRTDSLGEYEVSVADDGEYIAMAYTYPDSVKNGSYLFIPIYYDQVTDPSEAVRIKLTGDLSGIDFVLPDVPSFDNSLSGKILDKDGLPISEAYVTLYLVETSDEYKNWRYFGFASKTETDGSYESTNLIPGKYIAFAYAYNRGKFVPGYYKAGEPSTMNWEDATRIEIGETSNVQDINIALEEFKGLLGAGSVHGKVYGDEKKQIVKGMDASAAETPISGANVYAVNVQGQTVGSAQTSNDGSFYISGLDKGDYTLSIDKVGYVLSNVNITLSDDTEKSNADINIHNKGLYENKPTLAFATVAPNPAAETLRLDFTADGATRVSLVNSLGVKVYSAELGSLSGASTHSIELGSLPQGSYYAIIESGARASALPVIIIK